MAGLPLAGALFGLCLGGPVGLLAGAKVGGLAAVGGSILEEDWMLKQCILLVFLFGTRCQKWSIASRDICNIFVVPEST